VDTTSSYCPGSSRAENPATQIWDMSLRAPKPSGPMTSPRWIEDFACPTSRSRPAGRTSRPPAASRRAPPAASDPPAVDQELDEGATLRVAPILADPLATFEVGQREDVKQFCSASGPRESRRSREVGAQLVGSCRRVFNSNHRLCSTWTTHDPTLPGSWLVAQPPSSTRERAQVLGPHGEARPAPR
jgi:hypothetical protein